MPTSERLLRLLPLGTRGGFPEDRPSARHTDHVRQAAFPTSRAVRGLLVSVAAISVITSVLAVQALWTPLNQHQVAVAVAAHVLVPSLWAASLGV